MTLIPESRRKKFKPNYVLLNSNRFNNTPFVSRKSEFMQFIYEHPYVDMEVLQHYMRYSPNFIFSRDLWAEYYLKFQYGVEIIFDTLDLRAQEIRFDKRFMAENYLHFRSLKERNFTVNYLTELSKVRSRLPRGFLDPIEYLEAPLHPRYGTVDPKRRWRRLKYKNSKYYNIWNSYLKARREVFNKFSVYNKQILIKKKFSFQSIPNFRADEFSPRTFQEALYFFFIYGPPKPDCKDMNKVNLFYRCLLSGFYFEREKLYGPGYLFFERRLLSFQYMEVYQHQHRFEKYLSLEPLENESRPVFLLRRLGAYVYLFFRACWHTVQIYYIKTKERIRLKVGRSVNFTRALLGEIADLVRLWMAEFSPFFADNERSFMWLLISLKVEVWFLTLYVLTNEFNNEARGTDYVEIMPGEAGDFWVDQLTYYVIDLPYEIYELCLFYIMLPIRPILDLTIFLPFWIVVDRLYAFFVNFRILKNNFWYSILTFGNKEGRVAGRIWKIPLIITKWFIKIVLYFIFVVTFLFMIDYRTYIAPVFQPVFPIFDLYSDEVFVTYILIVFTVGLLIFGSFTIREFIWLDMGPTEWASFWFVNLNRMWDYEPILHPAMSFFPSQPYPDNWEDFSMISTQELVVTHDEGAGHLAKGWESVNTAKWRTYTFRLSNDLPAWGEDHEMAERLRQHRR